MVNLSRLRLWNWAKSHSDCGWTILYFVSCFRYSDHNLACRSFGNIHPYATTTKFIIPILFYWNCWHRFVWKFTKLSLVWVNPCLQKNYSWWAHDIHCFTFSLKLTQLYVLNDYQIQTKSRSSPKTSHSF